MKASRVMCLVLFFAVLAVVPDARAVVITPGMLCESGDEEMVLVPYMDFDYAYWVGEWGCLPGFEDPAFDDTGFSVGQGSFGTYYTGCPLNSQGYVATYWPLGTDIVMRKVVALPEGAYSVRVQVANNNGHQIWVNGVEVTPGMVTTMDCPGFDDFTYFVPTTSLIPGENLFAVRARDFAGQSSFIDISVIACVPPCVDSDGDYVCDVDDNCPDVPNSSQGDSDLDGVGDVCDNCMTVPNADQKDWDVDGKGDVCDPCPKSAWDDKDGDGLCGDVDRCAKTVLPESVPLLMLGVNRFADVDGDGVFETVPPEGEGPGKVYTLEDTAGCTCEQIIQKLGVGRGHEKFGCSISVMDEWVMLNSQ